ncbi:hypothetical protein [Prosthecobacter sp.]|uniref:hypothetical protein n=1 Tax=Prosthecobacter sp. TaxID=1965333 RepID=UPI003782E406
MPADSSAPVTGSIEGFASLSAARRAHTDLLRRQRSDTANGRPQSAEIRQFIFLARATGRHVAAADARDALQGMIDYWYGILVMADRAAANDLGSLNLDDNLDDGLSLEGFQTSKSSPPTDSEVENRARAQTRLKAEVFAFEKALSSADQPWLRLLLLRLFTLGEVRHEPRRAQLQKSDKMLGEPALTGLVDKLRERGLLKTEASTAGPDTAYILADENLLQHWKTLAQVVTERRSLREMVAGWDRSGRPAEALLDKGAMLDLAADYADLTDAEKDFLRQSQDASLLKIQQKSKRMWQAITVLTVLVVILIGLVAALIVQMEYARVAERDAREAEDRAIKSADVATEKAQAASAAETEAKRQTDLATKALDAEKQQKELAIQAQKLAVAARTDAEKARADAAKEARERELLLRAQLDATNQAAAEMRAIVENFSKAAEEFVALRAALASSLNDEGLKLFDKTASKLKKNLKESLDLAKNSAATTAKLDEATGSATQEAQKEAKDPQPSLVKVLEGHRLPITALTFARDGSKLATAGEDTEVRVWTPKGEPFTQPITGSSKDGVNCLAFSPDKEGRWLAIGSRGSTVRLRDLSQGRTEIYEGHRDSVTSISFSADGSKVLSSSADKTVQIWNPLTREAIQKFRPAGSLINGAAFNSDATRVVGALEGNAAMVWTVGSDADPLRLPREGPVRSAWFNPRGDQILTSSLDKTVAVWSPTPGSSGNPPLIWAGGLSGPLFQAVFSPDGSRVACATGGQTTKIWDARTGKLLRELKGHQDAVYLVAYHPSGRIMLTGSADSTAKVWFEGETEARHTLTGHTAPLTAVTFNDAGTQIATGSQDGTVILYDFQKDNDGPPPETAGATGWCLYGWLDLNSKGEKPQLRAQSFAPKPGVRGAIPTVGLEAEAEAIMNVRDEVKKGENNHWSQGKVIDLLRKGDRVKILEVLGDNDMITEPHAVWIKFKKL